MISFVHASIRKGCFLLRNLVVVLHTNLQVLKKADMIRKNAVESILAERDILISVRNPFVVRYPVHCLLFNMH